MKFRIRVEAGPHRRRNCPVEVPLPGVALTAPRSVRVSSAAIAGVDLTADPEGARGVFLLRDLPAGESVEFILDTDAVSCGESVTFERQPGEGGETVAVSVGGAVCTRFVADSGAVRPFFHPVLDPAGTAVTRSFPMARGVPGENEDHPHHRSFYVAHGDVNGHDFWSETPGHGVQRLEQACDLRSGCASGDLHARVLWIDRDGEPVLRDERTFRFYDVEGIRLLDVRLGLRADFGAVSFGDTKEGGLISFRVAGTLKGTSGGTIRNAYGAIGEGECWGRAAPWVDYSGPVGDHTAGITVMDHPLNFRYPTRWHVRDYGLFAVNPFALSYYRNSFETDGSYRIPAGARLTMRYRVLIHLGGADTAVPTRAFIDYAHPPTVTVEPLAAG